MLVERVVRMRCLARKIPSFVRIEFSAQRLKDFAARRKHVRVLQEHGLVNEIESARR